MQAAGVPLPAVAQAGSLIAPRARARFPCPVSRSATPQGRCPLRPAHPSRRSLTPSDARASAEHGMGAWSRQSVEPARLRPSPQLSTPLRQLGTPTSLSKCDGSGQASSHYETSARAVVPDLNASEHPYTRRSQQKAWRPTPPPTLPSAIGAARAALTRLTPWFGTFPILYIDPMRCATQVPAFFLLPHYE